MARIAVTGDAVRAYLAANMTDSNYQLFFGLYSLQGDPASYQAVWDALLNGDCQPEELVRLGTFTPAEVQAFLQSVVGNWVSPTVASPTVGTNGYAYLTTDLGLTALLQAVCAPPPPLPVDPGRFLAARIYTGQPGGSYANPAAFGQVFAVQVLPGALGATPFPAVFPSSQDDFNNYVAAGVTDAGTLSVGWSWFSGIFPQLIGVEDYTAGNAIFQVDGDSSAPFASSPGMAQWVLVEPPDPPRARLLLLREAAVRTARGPYAKADVDAALTSLETLSPTVVGTSRSMGYAYFWTADMVAAAQAGLAANPGDPDWASYAVRAASCAGAYSVLAAYRAQLRTFLAACYAIAAQTIDGYFPPN